MKAQLKADGWHHGHTWTSPDRRGHIAIDDYELEVNEHDLAGLLNAKKNMLAQVLARTGE